MKAGVGKADITPPLPVFLGGFALRTEPATSVRDRLYARALALEDGHCRAAVVAVDLLGVDRELAGRVRAWAARGLAIPREAVMVVATHTHAGPEGFPRTLQRGLFVPKPAPAPPAVRRRVLAGMRAALRQAWEERVPVRLVGGVAAVEGVAGNRRCPGGPTDPRLGAVGLLPASARGRPAWVLHYACHPTTLGPENRRVSADYPGELCRWLEQEGCGALFLPGAAGDQSTRPTRTERGEADLARTVQALIRGAAAAVAGARPLALGRITARTRVWRPEWLRAEGLPAPEDRLEVHALCLGEWKLLGVSGEVFAATGLSLRDGPFTWPVGYANGYVGYLPDAGAWPAGGYEVEVARAGPGTAEAVLEAGRTLLGEEGCAGKERGDVG